LTRFGVELQELVHVDRKAAADAVRPDLFRMFADEFDVDRFSLFLG